MYGKSHRQANDYLWKPKDLVSPNEDDRRMWYYLKYKKQLYELYAFLEHVENFNLFFFSLNSTTLLWLDHLLTNEILGELKYTAT